MMDRRIWRGAMIAALAALALTPTRGLAFPQSTETSGEIATDLNGVWLVVNRLEFPKPTATPAANASPGAEASPAPGQAAVRNFTVANLFTIVHLPTAEAQKLRDAEKDARQASFDKATKILNEELQKAAKSPQPAASGETPVEPRVMRAGIPRLPDSVVDLYDEVAVTMHDVDMPKAIQDEINAANKAEKPWEPTPKELETLKATWKTLKPKEKTEYSRIQWKVMADKYIDEGMKQDEKTRDAKFVISGDETLIAGPGQANRNIVVYGAKEIHDDVIEGGHVRAIMTAAPFPIPIDMKGSFKMYKLEGGKKPPAKKAK